MLLFVIIVIFLIKDLRKILYSSLFILAIFIFSIFLFELGKFNPGNRIFLKTFNQITNYIYLEKEDKIVNKKIDEKKKN